MQSGMLIAFSGTPIPKAYFMLSRKLTLEFNLCFGMVIP